MLPGPYAPICRLVEYNVASGAIRGVYEFPRDEIAIRERKPREDHAFLEVHEPVDALTSRVVDGKLVTGL